MTVTSLMGRFSFPASDMAGIRKGLGDLLLNLARVPRDRPHLARDERLDVLVSSHKNPELP